MLHDWFCRKLDIIMLMMQTKRFKVITYYYLLPNCMHSILQPLEIMSSGQKLFKLYDHFSIVSLLSEVQDRFVSKLRVTT